MLAQSHFGLIRDLKVSANAGVAGVALAMAVCLVGCGGGGDVSAMSDSHPLAAAPQQMSADTAEARQFAASARLAAATMAYGGASTADAVDQLLNYGEAVFSQFFPGHKTTHAFGKFRFRFYPETGVYLGVAVGVEPGDGLVEAGVYVVVTGGAPVFVGVLTNFITPVVVVPPPPDPGPVYN